MALKTAEAALTTSFGMGAITGFNQWRQGFIDPSTGYVRAIGRNSWSNLSTWEDFRSYSATYEQIRWTSDLVDVGEIKDFTLKIETDYEGSLFFIIDVSDDEVFGVDSQQYVVVNGDYDVPAFRGRYVYVTAIVDGRELRRMTITSSSQKSTRVYNNINTASLSGSSAARTFTLPVPVSKIVELQIQPKTPNSYAVDLYVSSTATSTVLIPMVISKTTTGPTFSLVGIDNQPRDGVVDITMTTMPRQAMIGGNLLVIE